MPPWLQTLVVIAIGVAAGGYLLRRAQRRLAALRGRSTGAGARSQASPPGCPGCSGCGTEKPCGPRH
jgi:hypothetical protein